MLSNLSELNCLDNKMEKGNETYPETLETLMFTFLKFNELRT